MEEHGKTAQGGSSTHLDTDTEPSPTSNDQPSPTDSPSDAAASQPAAQPKAASGEPPSGEAPQDFGAILAEFEHRTPEGSERRADPAPGQKVSGKVVSIREDSVFVDLGTKSEGMIE